MSILSGSVLVNEHDEVQALRNLSCRELVLVRLPKAPAASVLAVMTDAVATEADIRIAHLILQHLQVQSALGPVDATDAHAALHLEANFVHAVSITAP
jgi:hypothetical protein